MQPSQLNPNEDPGKDTLALSKVIERTIRTIIHLRTKDAIQDQLGIVDHAYNELADFEMETRPEDVLAEIHRLQAIESSKG